MLILIICSLAIRPPENLPDLWTLLICVYSFVHFIFFLFIFNLIQLTLKHNDLYFTQTESKNGVKLLFNFESLLTNQKTISLKEKKIE